MKKSLMSLAVLALALVSTVVYANEMGIADVLALFASVDPVQLIVFSALAFIGVLAHLIVMVYFTKTLATAPGTNFLSVVSSYLFGDRMGNSLTMVFSILSMGSAYFATASTPIAWPALILAAVTAGYTSDSMFNRSSAVKPSK